MGNRFPTNMVEGLESRCLLSSVLTPGSLAIGSEPQTVTAGSTCKPPLRVELVAPPNDRPIRSVTGPIVSLSIEQGANAGKQIATAKLVNGVATFRKLPVFTTGTYVFQALTGVLETVTGVITVVPAKAQRLTATGQAGLAYPGVAYFTATLFDKYGNVATNDTSYIQLWHETNPLVGIDATGFNQVYDKKGIFLGQRFVNGVVNFDVDAIFGSGTVTVVFSDSRRAINHVKSIPWLARA